MTAGSGAGPGFFGISKASGLMVLKMSGIMDRTMRPVSPSPRFDLIEAVFPHPVLTKIIGEPNLASITLQQSEHNRNLASIKSKLGYGLTGLMVLSMKPDIFKTIHPDAFVIPTNPGPAPEPAVIAASSTATKIADIYKAYALESAIYAEYVTAKRISVKLALDSSK